MDGAWRMYPDGGRADREKLHRTGRNKDGRTFCKKLPFVHLDFYAVKLYDENTFMEER